MGSGVWFKTIIGRKKTKRDRGNCIKGHANEKSNGYNQKDVSPNESSRTNGVALSGKGSGIANEDIAAIKIQNAFRKYRARKALRSRKGQERLEIMALRNTVQKQAHTTLSYIQMWSKIQSEIRTRRASMVTETRIRQKKQENQMKLEAKLHDLEVEWDGGSETMEEIVARIYQREEAAVKRERAMAYAFSHQWRANSSHGQLAYDFGNGTWGWSWLERWVAVRPWENRFPTQSIMPSKSQTKASSGKPAKIPSPIAKTLSNPAITKKSTGNGAANLETFKSNAKKKNGKVDQEPQTYITV